MVELIEEPDALEISGELYMYGAVGLRNCGQESVPAALDGIKVLVLVEESAIGKLKAGNGGIKSLVGG